VLFSLNHTLCQFILTVARNDGTQKVRVVALLMAVQLLSAGT
jgi:hypothetical protein